MVSEFLRAFIMIFMAEMGDKSQILAMSFASKYNVKKVFIGLFIGILFNHILAVLIGTQLGQLIPLSNLTFVAGVLFVIFGFYSLRIDKNEAVELQKTKWGPIITIAILFFVGELGDKTQLAAITLSSEATYPLIILAGTVIGMLVTSMLGIFIGVKFGKKIPVIYMKALSSIVFIMFGYAKLLQNTITINESILFGIIGVVTLLYIVALILFIIYQRNSDSLYIKTALALKQTYSKLQVELDSICLGLAQCGECLGNQCIIGYTKRMIKDVIAGNEINIEYTESKIVKEYNKEKIVEALDLILLVLKDDFQNTRYSTLHTIRNNFEIIIYGAPIIANDYIEYKSTVVHQVLKS